MLCQVMLRVWTPPPAALSQVSLLRTWGLTRDTAAAFVFAGTTSSKSMHLSQTQIDGHTHTHMHA